MKALVTGGGIRLGRAMALYLGQRGHDVAVHYNGSADAAEAVAAELRDMGFKAPIFICSANDDLQSMDLYRKAGASGTLSKYLPVPEVATDLVSQCNSFYRNRNQYYNQY